MITSHLTKIEIIKRLRSLKELQDEEYSEYREVNIKKLEESKR